MAWLAEGDTNSAFFYRSIQARGEKNYIHFLVDDADCVIDKPTELKRHIVGFYENLLGGQVDCYTADVSEIDSLLQFRCSDSARSLLQGTVSDLEIKQAFFSLPCNKTAGPDGYSAEFFKANWDVVGQDVTDAILEFFSSGRLLQQWNSTTLVLIPKVQNAANITDFRPISCCNTLYKVISRLLASKLKVVLPDLISLNQSAFIPGRLLVENVLLATELINGYSWKNVSSRAMLKVDLRKAFDSVKWDFLIFTMCAMNFPESFITLVHQCISTTRFSVAINGELSGYFGGSGGLRQGDPLSPYLFVLVMEVFSQLLHSKYTSGRLGFHPNATQPDVSHLAFADDIMVFFDRTVFR